MVVTKEEKCLGRITGCLDQTEDRHLLRNLISGTFEEQAVLPA
jgi:hypothetical protein